MSEQFEFEPRMSDTDALMWRIEKDPLLRSTITSVALLDRAPDHDRFVERIDRASRVVPRLRQRVLGHAYSVAPPRWETDPNFDLHYHLRWIRVAGSGSLRELLDIAEPIAMQGFDRARPLWEFVVVEGLENGRAALIQKVHHSITDGVGGVKLQLALLDLEREPDADDAGPLPPAPEAQPTDEVHRAIDALLYEGRRQAGTVRDLVGGLAAAAADSVQDPVGVANRALRLAGSTARLLRPANEPCSPLMSERSLSVHFETLRLDLRQLKEAARVVSGRLNDAFVAGVTGGLARYHAEQGASVEYLRMTMPINIRSERDERHAGNHFVPARFTVPVGIKDPVARMTAIRQLVESERHEPALGLTEPLAGLLNRLPTTATTAVFGTMLRGTDFITSNVPGAPFEVFVAGARVDAQYAFGPLTGAAVSVVLLSYRDEAHLAINLDPAAVTDPELLVRCIEASFDELFAVA
jgi:diacylglycerol O-acyltransferase / wax synthase